MLPLMVQGHDIVDGMQKLAKEVDGAITPLALTDAGIYAFRSPNFPFRGS